MNVLLTNKLSKSLFLQSRAGLICHSSKQLHHDVSLADTYIYHIHTHI